MDNQFEIKDNGETVNVDIDKQEELMQNINSVPASGTATFDATKEGIITLDTTKEKLATYEYIKEVDPLEILAERCSMLEKQNEALTNRTIRLEDAIKRTLEVAIRSEQLNELTVTSILHKTFSAITESLTESIINMKHNMDKSKQRYVIDVVNNVTVLATDETIKVNKRGEHYIYEKANEPGKVIERGMEIFDNYFKERPQLFKDNNSVLVNIYVQKEQPKDD